MGRIAFAVIAVVSALAAATLAAKTVLADEMERLIGTWKLVEAVSEDLATGEKTNIYKGGAVGFITYGADQRVMVVIVDAGRNKPTGNVATGPEAEALFRTMAAYAGSYMIKGNQIIHHVDVSWNETWTGTDQVRNFNFDGERLRLATAPSPNPFSGKMSVRTLAWEKVK